MQMYKSKGIKPLVKIYQPQRHLQRVRQSRGTRFIDRTGQERELLQKIYSLRSAKVIVALRGVRNDALAVI